MFNIGDAVFYGVHGVCIVEEINGRDVFGKVSDYYTLRPIYSFRSKVFVPVERTDKSVELRNVISYEDAESVVHKLKDAEIMWDDDRSARKAKFAVILRNCIPSELAVLVKTVYLKKKELEAQKKKLHSHDERALDDAERILFEELSFVFGIKREEVSSFIMQKLGL